MNTQHLTKTEIYFRPSSSSAEKRRDILSRVVEAEIIPRLLMVHRPAENRSASLVTQPTHAEVIAFSDLLLADDLPAIKRYISNYRSRGGTVESVFLGLMTDSARHLGEMWGKDTCNFCEVTLAIWRMQQLLHDLSPAFQCEGGTLRGSGKRVLLSSIAAEQHTLGLSMVAEFFRRGGWEVLGDIPVSNSHLIDAVAGEWLDLVGLSVSCDMNRDELTATVAGIRKMSRNPNIVVMVGGWLFHEKPELAVAIGADFMARDAREAVARADEMVEQLFELKARPSSRT